MKKQKDQKFTLKDLRVKSFVTKKEKEFIVGGDTAYCGTGLPLQCHYWE
jgi:hypothetical protein